MYNRVSPAENSVGKIHKINLSNLCHLLETFFFLILDSLIPITSRLIFVLSTRYSSSSIIPGREYGLLRKRLEAFLWFRL